MDKPAEVVLLYQPSFSGKLPRRRKNAAIRSREYLTADEVLAQQKVTAN